MSGKTASNDAPHVLSCIACKQEIPSGATLCHRCHSYQHPWKNELRYHATILGVVTFILTGGAYVASLIPGAMKSLTWGDHIQVLDFKIPGSIVLVNSGDGDVLVHKVYWAAKIEGLDLSETYFINKKISVHDSVEIVEASRKDWHKFPLARYLLDNEVPKASRKRMVDEALSTSNPCLDLRVSLQKERGMLEQEMTHKQAVWSFPIEATFVVYSLHSKATFEEKITALGFILKGEDASCSKQTKP